MIDLNSGILTGMHSGMSVNQLTYYDINLLATGVRNSVFKQMTAFQSYFVGNEKVWICEQLKIRVI